MRLMDNSYLAINFKVQPISGIEILIAELSLLEFELFEENPNGLVAYISRTNFSKKIFEKVRILNSKEFKINYEIKKIQNKNWNEEWEKNYNQVIINDFCTIRAPFHKPSGKIYDIVIKPEMSFGTGHHETTKMMISFLLDLNCNNKSVLDMGSGTGVLGILAEKKGAKAVLAVDNDPWCVKNTQENLELNKCFKSKTELNNTVPLKNTFDMVLANINRNVLLEQISDYGHILVPEGDLLLSGFYFEDLGMIQNACQREGFRFIRNLEKKNWVAAYFTKHE